MASGSRFVASVLFAALAVGMAGLAAFAHDDAESLAHLRKAFYRTDLQVAFLLNDVAELQSDASDGKFSPANAPIKRVHSYEAAPADALAAKGNVVTAEVVRRGPAVEHVAGDEGAFGQTVDGTPADDNDKWFVSILTQEGCPPCKRLLADWETSPYLQALGQIDPTKQKESWSHLHVYDAGDETQKHRWDETPIGGFPTVIVQAPLNGRFGPSTHIVFQKTGYDGNHKRLYEEALEAIAMRMEKYPSSAPRDGAGSAVGASNNLGPKPVTRGPNLLPLVDRDVDLPPEEETTERGLLRRRGVTAVAGELWGECNGACGGWLPIVLAAIGVLQQVLVRKFPDGPDAPGTPPLVQFLLRILGPITAVTAPTIGPKKTPAAAAPTPTAPVAPAAA